MESQKLKNNGSKSYGTGRNKTHNYQPGGIQYYINRISNITGYRKSDVEVVIKCFAKVLDECLIEVIEDNKKAFTFGPIEIYGKNITRTDYWKNPNTGELVKLIPHVVPAVKIRPKWKESFSTRQNQKRKELNIDINGEPL